MQDETLVDLSEVTIVNESRSEGRPEDVSLFRTAEEACRYLEPWWVRDGEGTAFSATGDRLLLADTDPVSVRSREPHPDGDRLVREWLRSCAASLQRARGEAVASPTSLTDLIKYCGFQR
jgi:hypothetical protein